MGVVAGAVLRTGRRCVAQFLSWQVKRASGRVASDQSTAIDVVLVRGVARVVGRGGNPSFPVPGHRLRLTGRRGTSERVARLVVGVGSGPGARVVTGRRAGQAVFAGRRGVSGRAVASAGSMLDQLRAITQVLVLQGIQRPGSSST